MSQQVQNLYQKLSKKYNLPEETIAYIVQNQFAYVKQQLKEGNEVLLHNFGSYELIKKNLNTKLKNLIKKLRKEKDKKIEEEFKKFWKIKNNYAKKHV